MKYWVKHASVGLRHEAQQTKGVAEMAVPKEFGIRAPRDRYTILG
jgi:hypothetical protein